MNLIPARYNAEANLTKKVLGNLIRGFFAYLALTPVIFCWGLLLIVLSVITLASFEGASTDVVAGVVAMISDLIQHVPFLNSFTLESSAIINPGVIEINNDNLGDVIFGFYGFIALPFVTLGLLLDLVRGPRPPRSLIQKIKILGLATLAVIAALFMNFLFGTEIWQGSLLTWSLMFTIGPGIVCLISAVSLSLHHFIVSLDFETAGNPELPP